MAQEPINKTVGRQIRQYRRRLGMTVEQFADRVGVSPTQITRIEIGATGSPLPRLQVMAEVLGVALADLLPKSEPSADHLQIAFRHSGLSESEVEQVLNFAASLRRAQPSDETDD